jgi:hypothetical protein
MPVSNHAGLILRDAVRRPSGGTALQDEGRKAFGISVMIYGF